MLRLVLQVAILDVWFLYIKQCSFCIRDIRCRYSVRKSRQLIIVNQRSFKKKNFWLLGFAIITFQQYFSYIVAASFIGRGNRITRRKLPTCLNSMTNFIT